MRNVVLIVFASLCIASGGAAGAEARKPVSTSAPAKVNASVPSAESGGKRVKVSYRKNGTKSVHGAAAAAGAANATDPGLAQAANGVLEVKSTAALVLDSLAGTPLYEKNTAQVSAIASITKLMTAMVVLDAGLALDEPVRIDKGDIDTIKGTGSRLRIGSVFSRRDLLHMALMSSENRAASALGRSYAGGMEAFVQRMNAKAQELGMHHTRFAEPTGLSPENVSTAADLALLVRASLEYPLIRDFTTTPSAHIHAADTGHAYGFANSNGLVRTPNWQIDVSKTGYINEAGQCLVMQARIRDRPVIIVLLDSWGRLSRIGDANRIRKWLESGAAGKWLESGAAAPGRPG